MLNYVNGKIPNALKEIISSRGYSIADIVRMSGMVRPTVVKLIDGEDSYLSKMALLCDCLDIRMSDVYGSSPTLHQENHAHDNSRPTMIGYNFASEKMSHYEQRINDLEDIVKGKDELIEALKKLLEKYESSDSD